MVLLFLSFNILRKYKLKKIEMSCSCIFSEDDWDDVVKRFVKCQYNFDNHDQIQKEEKVKRTIKNKCIVKEKRKNKKFMRN